MFASFSSRCKILVVGLFALTLMWGNCIAAQPEQITAGRTFYVTLNGTDSHPGTVDQPFRTLAKGVSVLKPGDTLLIGAGTYFEALNNTIPSGESWDKPVTVKAIPGDTVILRPGRSAERVITFEDDRHHIIVDGLILDATYVIYDGIKFQGALNIPSPHDIQIVNSEIKNAREQGILVPVNADHMEFRNLVIHNNGRNDFQHGIYIESSYNIVEGCTIYNNAGWGVHIFGGTDSHNIVRNNAIYDNARVGHRGLGIGIYSGQDNLVYNNVIWGHNQGRIATDYDAIATKIYNNTIYNNRDFGVFIGAKSTGAIVRNNIIYQPGQDALDDSGVATTKDHNLLDNPSFLNPTLPDLHLTPNSPAIGAGIPLPEVTTDFDGFPRPHGDYAIGAYEFVGQAAASGGGTGN